MRPLRSRLRECPSVVNAACGGHAQGRRREVDGRAVPIDGTGPEWWADHAQPSLCRAKAVGGHELALLQDLLQTTRPSRPASHPLADAVDARRLRMTHDRAPARQRSRRGPASGD